MSDTDALLLCSLCSMSSIALVVVVLVTNKKLRSQVVNFFKSLLPSSKGSSSKVTGAAATGNSSSCNGGAWCNALATWYMSYPPCCKDAPNYDPNADKSECTDYNGCKWMGQFAGVDGKLSYDEVKSKSIVAFYEDANQSGSGAASWWNKNARNRDIIVKNPQTGKTMTVKALDTCGNSDCDNCCSKNAKKGGGFLIDFEINTAKRFWGGNVPDEAKIQWKWA